MARERFFIPSNQLDKDTLPLRGIHGTFKPECEEERITCQQALVDGASHQLPQAEETPEGYFIYFDRAFIGSAETEGSSLFLFTSKGTFIGAKKTLAQAADALRVVSE